MLKRTKGYFLLTMLVLTGLAGRLHSDILSGKERRMLLDDLKITKSAFLQSTDKLTNRQLNFKLSKEELSIREYTYLAAEMEKRFQHLVTQINQLQNQSSFDKRIELSNEQLTPLVIYTDDLKKAAELIPLNRKSSEKELAASFKEQRTGLIKYVRTTTENLHHYIIKANNDSIDLYQLAVKLTDFDRNCLKQIEQLRQQPSFPAK